MATLTSDSDLKGLGRLCETLEASGIKAAPDTPGISRIGARFYGNAYAPHRHDTYSLGFTIHGVQKFFYRGASRFSMPGNVIILHPDELHDGGAGTEDGLVYKMLYLEPAVLSEALGGDYARLPFAPDPVVTDARMQYALSNALADLENSLDDLATDQLLTEVADGLKRHAGESLAGPRVINTKAAQEARRFLDENLNKPVTSHDLETASGIDRFALARHFRALYGTSPHRYLVMRRLENAKHLMQTGMPLAETAVEAGFSDQSHFNRQFKKAFGMTPGRWSTLTSAA